MRTMYNIEDRRPTDRPTLHFGKFQTAISRQRVIRSTSCLVLGRVFGDGGSNGAISGFTKSKMAPSWKISNSHISGTGCPIDFVFDPRVVFS